ncbi:MAG: hypothetical protein BMS9Abin12_0681 [Acidimicrobiia bacterium]|nr:MAG: hypothetical protein BMS9Abin12_0681 [Acidimicrobiia bacterium]
MQSGARSELGKSWDVSPLHKSPFSSARRLGAVALAITALSVACTSSDSGATTSTSPGASLTTLTTTQASEPGSDSTTTTAVPKSVLTAPEYKIIDRSSGEGVGDTVVVLLDAGTYDSLTDLDLFDLIAEVVELFPPIEVVHVVDSAAAANVVGDPDASEADRQAVAANYLARLDSGFKITYLGPFASSGTAVLGS